MASVANATEFPIPEKQIREHFYHDDLYQKLSSALEEQKRRFKHLDDRAIQFTGAKAVIPFSHAKWKVHFSDAQIREARQKGWVETWRFGWPISEKSILRTLPPWLNGVIAEERRLEVQFSFSNAPLEKVEQLNRKRQRLSDFIGNQRSILLRLKQWDEWCRKGPWLLESSNPSLLQIEIERLEAWQAGRSGFPFELFTSVDRNSGSDALQQFARENLKAKRTVWNWYHAFKPDATGKRLRFDGTGYRLQLRYELYGPGARPEMASRIREAIRQFWQGEVGGKPFVTEVQLSIRKPGAAAQPDAMQVYIGGEEEAIWPMAKRLPYHVDIPTIAHELGHGLGFTDRYRDVYSFEDRTYHSYQWDLLNLMSAQNGPDPKVSELDLKTLIDHYLDVSGRKPM